MSTPPSLTCRARSRFLPLLVLLAALCGGGFWLHREIAPALRAARSSSDDVQRALEVLRTAQTRLEADLAKMQAERDRLSGENATLRSENASLRAKLDDYAQRVLRMYPAK